MALQKIKRFSGSLYRGVCFQKGCGYGQGLNTLKKPWYSYIFHQHKKRIHLGHFQTMNEAGIAYNEASIKIFGKDATLNHIIDIPETTSKNPLWLTSKFGKYWRKESKKEICEKIEKNINEFNKDDLGSMVKWINGDESGFNFLYNKYYKFWLNVVKYEANKFGRKTQRKNQIKESDMQYEDIVTNGVMSIIKSIKRGRFDGIDFMRWSNRIMRNRWHDYVIKRDMLPSWYTRKLAKKPRGVNRKPISIYDDLYRK